MRVIRGLASSALVAVLVGGLASCGGDAESTSATRASDRPSTSTAEPSSPTYTSTAAPGVLDACSIISVDLIAEHFSQPQIILPEDSYWKDPSAADCTWRGLDMKASAHMTSDAERYLSRQVVDEDFADLAGAEPIDDVDYGYAFGNGERGVFFVEFAKNGVGVLFSITVDDSEHDQDDAADFAADLIERLSATTA